jgi:hypothetical protein
MTIADRIAQCPPISDRRPEEIRALLLEWLTHPSLIALVGRWGGSMPSGAASQIVAYLVELSEVWDFRGRNAVREIDARSQDAGGGSRWEITAEAVSESDASLVMESATALGLVTPRAPVRQTFDFVLVLGGARLSNLFRVRRAAELLRNQKIAAENLVLLGAMRQVMPGEREATDTYAPDARTEFDLFVAALEHEMGRSESEALKEGLDDDDNPNRSWAAWYFPRTFDAPPTYVLAAPSAEPDVRRANSSDAYSFFAGRLDPHPESSCLLVTSQIYVPYQHLEAVRTLAVPRTLDLETVGHSHWGGSAQGLREPANYLQEIRSTILSASRLLDAIELV